jgi:hypothetical protein
VACVLSVKNNPHADLTGSNTGVYYSGSKLVCRPRAPELCTNIEHLAQLLALSKKYFHKCKINIVKCFFIQISSSIFVSTYKQSEFNLLNLIIMITIIQNQYETAKQLLALCEFNLKCVQAFNAQKDFDIYYNNVSSLLTIVGGVSVFSKVVQDVRGTRLSMIEECRQRFAAYEAELMQAGLLLSRWEQILSDVEPTEPVQEIEYTENEKCEMWAEYITRNNYDYDSRR